MSGSFLGLCPCWDHSSEFARVGLVSRTSPCGTALYCGTTLGAGNRCSPRPGPRRLESDRLPGIITHGLQPGLIQRFRLSNRRLSSGPAGPGTGDLFGASAAGRGLASAVFSGLSRPAGHGGGCTGPTGPGPGTLGRGLEPRSLFGGCRGGPGPAEAMHGLKGRSRTAGSSPRAAGRSPQGRPGEPAGGGAPGYPFRCSRNLSARESIF